MKKINVKLTIDELQALACIAAEKWMNPEAAIPSLEQIYKRNWKKLSEYLFKIYRINK